MSYKNKNFIMDMDGVIYFGNSLIDGAKEFIDKLKKNDNKYLFLTNNSSQTPLDLSKKLSYLKRSILVRRVSYRWATR